MRKRDRQDKYDGSAGSPARPGGESGVEQERIERDPADAPRDAASGETPDTARGTGGSTPDTTGAEQYPAGMAGH